MKELFSKTREELVEVFNNTIQDIENGYYINSDNERVKLNIKGLKSGSKMYSDEELHFPITSSNYFPETKIYVQNVDSFLKAIEFGKDSAVLNMASARTAGGGVSKGSKAQEESLCRRSNLMLSLSLFTNRYYNLTKDKRSEHYPIPTYGGIYSPNISIYKDCNYRIYKNPYITNIISVSAVINPSYDKDTLMISKSQIWIIKNKMRRIFRIAILHGHTKLVLGAFGCGAFCNPPKHIAQLFKEVLNEDEFKHAFEEICFAILDDNNTGKQHNPEGNYKPFVDVFGEKTVDDYVL